MALTSIIFFRYIYPYVNGCIKSIMSFISMGLLLSATMIYQLSYAYKWVPLLSATMIYQLYNDYQGVYYHILL